jgi:hypothetical protein
MQVGPSPVTPRSPWRVLTDAVEILLAAAGIFIRRPTPARLAVSVVCLGIWLLSALSLPPPPAVVALAFVGMLLVRYTFLFYSFVPGGIAERLIDRYGLDRGFQRYEALTALQFGVRAVTFTWLVQVTPLPVPLAWSGFLAAVGLALIGLGTLVNVWATDVVGLWTYYYGDLFTGANAAPREFKAVGPYRYLANPMYGLGQAPGYGAALLGGSVVGLLAAALNQALMYLFNAAIEAPHVARMRAASAAAPASRSDPAVSATGVDLAPV